MRWSLIALIVSIAGCQAPDELGDVSSARFVSEDPLAALVSDDPCGWDDPNVFHDGADAAPGSHQRCLYFDDGAEENAVTRWVYFRFNSDGSAYFGYDDDDAIVTRTATWARVEGTCAIELRATDGEMIAYLANPSPPSDPSDPGFYRITPFGANIDGIEDGQSYSCNGSTSSPF